MARCQAGIYGLWVSPKTIITRRTAYKRRLTEGSVSHTHLTAKKLSGKHCFLNKRVQFHINAKSGLTPGL
ncbi:hypothetical protein AOLI_G00092770 [Acnodon oligacanthus]